MTETYPINLWINEERYKELAKVGLDDKAMDVLAGMKLLKLQCTQEQKERILEIYPMAKYDSATTKSIELLPAEAKDRMFNLIIKRKNLTVIEEFLEGVS